MPGLLCIIRCTSDFAMQSCAERLAQDSRCHPVGRSRRSWRSRVFPSSTRMRNFMSKGISRPGRVLARLCRPRWFLFAATEQILLRRPKERAKFRGALRCIPALRTIPGAMAGAPSQSTNQRWNVFHSRPGRSSLHATAARRVLMRFVKLIRSDSCRSEMPYVLTCARLVPYAAILSRS